MSSPKHSRNDGFDTVSWILGGVIGVLTAIDLLVWVSLLNGYNPVDKVLPNQIKSAITQVR